MSTSPQTVRRWSSERKSQLVLKLLRGGDAAQLAREHGLRRSGRQIIPAVVAMLFAPGIRVPGYE
jgi:hypothetical protein